MALSAVAGVARAESPAVSEAWAVKPDPGTGPVIDKPQNPAGVVVIGSGFSPVIYPTYSSAFASPVNLGVGHILSPDGTYLACRPKDKHAVIAVINSRTGQPMPPLEVDVDPKRFAAPVDFAGKDRLLTMCHDDLFPLCEFQTVYQVWDLLSAKEVARFQTGLVWNGNYGSVSPGGRYFVMEKTETRSYKLLAWDLTTGKSAGETEFQGKNEPWGQASGMVFSPNGKELAVVWRLGKKDLWGKVMVFDVAAGKKVAAIPLDYTMKHIGLALNAGENRSLQWNPAGDGWLILGHLLMDRKSGEVKGRVGTEPGATWEVQSRRFMGPEYLTALVRVNMGRQLAFEAVPAPK